MTSVKPDPHATEHRHRWRIESPDEARERQPDGELWLRGSCGACGETRLFPGPGSLFDTAEQAWETFSLGTVGSAETFRPRGRR